KRCIECGCSEYYDCQLRLRADDFNVDITPYMGEVRKYKVDTRHPYIVMDPNKCINCGRCVRTCAEILKVSALGFVNRGFRSVVKPAMEKPLLETNCVACGNCIDTCPTGALTEKFPFKVLGTLPKENHEAVCHFCSIGCKVNFKAIDNHVYFVANSEESGVYSTHNRGYLCVKGRFGHRYLMEKNRLTKPLLREKDTFNEVSWDKALEYTAQKIKEIIAKYGPEAVALFGSPKMSNQELYLLQKFARSILKTNNIDSFSNLFYGVDLDSLDESLGYTDSTVSMDAIREADVVIVMNGNLSQENLVMELKIKEAQKHGAKMVLIDSAQSRATRFADLWIDSRKGSNTILMNGLIREAIEKGLVAKTGLEIEGFDALKKMAAPFTTEKVIAATDIAEEKYRRLLQWIAKPEQKIVFIYNIDAPRDKSKNDLKAIGNFLLLTGRLQQQGSGLIIMREYANSTGLMNMGVTPNYLPGFVKSFETAEIKPIEKQWNSGLEKVFKPVNLKEKLLKGEIKALLIFGEDPLVVSDNSKYFKDIEFLAVQEMFQTDTTADADVVLPAASYVEQDGSYTACDRRVQEVKRFMEPASGMENWKVIQALAQKFEKSFVYDSIADITAEIDTVNRFSAGNTNQYYNEKGKPVYALYDIDTAAQHPGLPTLLFSEYYYRTRIKSRLTR
ncbi:MAG: formate dehydrogenase alpha subunit, partial [Acidobacteriota bacterium]|nr:formate dehydrogenase alpha subunit [Acidobacteriota bacterium]